MTDSKLNDQSSDAREGFDTKIDSSTGLTAYHANADSNLSGSILPKINFLGTPSNVSVAEYLARPILLLQNTFTGTLTTTENPFLLQFLEQTNIQNKCRFFHLLRGTFNVTLVLTSDAYTVGQVVLSTYMGSILKHSYIGDDNNLTRYLLSTTHSVADIGSTTRATLSIPLHGPYPYVRVSFTEADKLALNMMVTLKTISPAVSTQTGSSSVVNYRVYGSILDAEVTVPVVKDYGAIYTMETNEAAHGPISYPASIVASITKRLSSIPIIGPYMYASNMIATGIGNLAILFGFSRPKDMSAICYPHEEDIAGYAGNLRVKTLTLDPQQEIPLSLAMVGEQGDNLSFENLVGRYGLWQTFDIHTTDSVGADLFQAAVSPCIVYVGEYSEICPTPLSYISQLYSLWRGSIVLKFVFPANKYIRGKFRIWWTPVAVTGYNYNDVIQNTTGIILDLSTSTTCEITIPWGVQSPYMPTFLLNDVLPGTDTANGVIHCSVEEQLVAPSDAYVQHVLVYMKAGEDIEFQIPNTSLINFLARTGYHTGIATINYSGVSPFPLPTPGPLTSVGDSSLYFATLTMESNSVNPTMTVSNDLLPGNHGTEHSMYNMGERFNSIRPLLKRFYPYMIVPNLNFQGYTSFFLPFLPIEYGVLNQGSLSYAWPTCNATPLRYVSNLFAGVRGSIRYRIGAYNATDTPNVLKRVLISRRFDIPFTLRNVDTVDNPIQYYTAKVFAGSGEAAFCVSSGEPIVIEIPHQFNSNYQTTNILNPYDVPIYGFGTDFPCGVTDSLEYHVSIGEDFQPVIWNGVPIMTRYARSES